MLRARRPEAGSDAGFTVVELAIVGLIASILLVMAGTSLISLDRTTSRTDSLVQQEQSASTVMARIERDLRSADAISIPSGTEPADELQLAILGVGGATTGVRWVYDPTARTLTRETLVGGSYQPTSTSISNLANSSSSPVFSYFDSSHTAIPDTSPSDIATCATAVDVDIQLSSSTAGVGNFDETTEVALTNQVQALTDPGNGQC